MRLVTWNIARGASADKAEFIAPLSPDILVLQECSRPAETNDQHLWFGTNAKKGLSIQAFGEYRISASPERENIPPYFIPIEVTGPDSFILFAVWAQKVPLAYVEGISSAIATYADIIESHDTVLIGDFNSNAIWDREHPAEHNHSAIVRSLDKLGCTSAYHEYFNESHGRELRNTYFHWWKEDRPFHIDYVFIPKRWLSRLHSVEVSSFTSHIGASDHRPVCVCLNAYSD